MKKIILPLFASLFFFACSSDEPHMDGGSEKKGLVFEITAKNQLVTTKAVGDPIYSQDDAQKITRVSIHAFKSDGTDYLYVKSYNVTDWLEGSTFKRYEVPVNDMLPEGDYQFLAIGRNATDLYEIPIMDATTKIGDVLASINTSGDEYEVFAGTAEALIESQGIRVSLTMTRKVAGVLGDFKNAPQLLNDKTVRFLRLTATAGNKAVFLASGVGTSVTGAYDIIDIDLDEQTVENEIYTGNDLTAVGVVKLPNSQLGGGFMIPVDGISLTLGLYDDAGLSIKTWTVTNADGETIFDILPNHFYSLGMKYKPDTTTGVDPDDLDDDDDAIDLLQDQTITITLDPAWNTIHPLTLGNDL